MRAVSFRNAVQSVGKGWAPLIRVLYKNKPDNINIVQVKEKFGRLRVYTEPYDEEYQRLIGSLEWASSKMCEKCGRRGNQDTYQYWMKTLCADCAAERRK
jgi:hypothetical protein